MKGLLAGRRQPDAGAAVEHVDLSGRRAARTGDHHALERHADREVGGAVAVEVADRERISEPVPRLGAGVRREVVLVEHLVQVAGQDGAVVVEDLDDALVAAREGLSRGADREIRVAVVVEVPGREGRREEVVHPGAAENARRVLVPAVPGRTGVVVHSEAPVRGRGERLPRRADQPIEAREVPGSIAPPIVPGERGGEEVARLAELATGRVVVTLQMPIGDVQRATAVLTDPEDGSFVGPEPVLARCSDQQRVVDVAAERRRGGEDLAEAIRGLDTVVGDRRRLLIEVAAAGAGEPRRRAEEDPDRAGIDDIGAVHDQVLEGAPDREVVVSVEVEATCGERPTPAIVRFGAAGHAGGALSQELVAGRPQPAGRAVEDVDRTGGSVSGDVFAGHADCQIDESVAVEVAGGDRAAQLIAGLARVGRAVALVEQDVAQVGELGAGRDRGAEQSRGGERGGRQDGSETVGGWGHRASSAGRTCAPGLSVPAQAEGKTAQRWARRPRARGPSAGSRALFIDSRGRSGRRAQGSVALQAVVPPDSKPSRKTRVGSPVSRWPKISDSSSTSPSTSSSPAQTTRSSSGPLP